MPIRLLIKRLKQTSIVQCPLPASVTIVLLFGFCLSLLFGCTADNQPLSNTLQRDIETPLPSENETITLVFPAAESENHVYYLDLLQRSLAAANYEVTIIVTEPMPQNRRQQSLEQDQISILNMLQSAERDEQFVSIDVDLTNGLIGNRILLIRPEDQTVFNQVQTLENFRNLGKVGAFGKVWFDVDIWRFNNLPLVEIDGDWDRIYGMLAHGDRGIDYFSRGFTEIIEDAEAHPDLAIENNLILIYDRDFRFYLAPSAANHKEMIEDALQQAIASGLIDELIHEYWKQDFETLNYAGRTKIYLATPE